MTFEDLYQVILERKKNLPEGSSTTQMMTQGLGAILPKLNEESFEVALALESQGKDDVALEVSQCFYYLLCLTIFTDQGFDNLELSPSIDELSDNPHEIAKKIAQAAAMVCHTPCITSINQLPPLLFRALDLAGSNREHMYSFL